MAGVQLIENLTLKYISPFFSTSFVISTNSCNKRLKMYSFSDDIELRCWILALPLSHLAEVEVVGICDAPTYQDLHQTLPQLSLINNTTQLSLDFYPFSVRFKLKELLDKNKFELHTKV